MSELNTGIQYLSGVGPKRAELLQRELGLSTLGDLIHFYPFRYIDRSGLQRISGIDSTLASVQVRGRVVQSTLYGPGSTVLAQSHYDANGQAVTVLGEVKERGGSGKTGDRLHFNAAKRLSVIVDDGSGRMEMVFFKGIKWNYQRLALGSEFIFFGKPQEFNGNAGHLCYDFKTVDERFPVKFCSWNGEHQWTAHDGPNTKTGQGWENTWVPDEVHKFFEQF